MQMSPHYMRIGKTVLASLAGRGVPVVESWIEDGLPVSEDGSILLFRALQFLAERHDRSRRERPLLTQLSQIQLCELLSVTRQSVYSWTRQGLPRNSDKTYSLPETMKWLRLHYRKRADQKYHKNVRTLRADLKRRIS